MSLLREVRALVIDMDGVLWEGARPLPGLTEFFAALRASGRRFILATNNASQTPAQYVAKLAGFGVRVDRAEVLTSAQAAAQVLRARGPAGAKVFPIGEAGLREALTEQGFQLLDLWETGAQYVVVGMDRGLNWDKLATATLNIRAGAVFVGTNPDKTIPIERGIVHGNGAVLAALQAATDMTPLIIGKPEPTMYQLALEQLGTPPAETIGLGDRLDTDIAGAVRAGLRGLLVLTGVSTRAEAETAPYPPAWIMDDIRAVTRALAD